MQQEEEDVFKAYRNFLMLKDTTEVIEIQVWVTRVINTQCNREVCQPPSGQGAVGVCQTAGDGEV